MFQALKALFTAQPNKTEASWKDGESIFISDKQEFKTPLNVEIVITSKETAKINVSGSHVSISKRDSKIVIERTKDVAQVLTITMSILPNLLDFYGNMNVKIRNDNPTAPSKLLKLNASFNAKIEFTTSVPMDEAKLHLSNEAQVKLLQAVGKGYHHVFADLNDASKLQVEADVRGLKVDLRDETELDISKAGLIGGKVINSWNQRYTKVKE